MAISIKVLVLSTGVLSVAMLLKLSAPLILEFAVSEVPLLYSTALSWLRPPYLYLLINCIIISIVASTKLQQKTEDDATPPPPEIVAQPLPPVKIATDYAVIDGVVSTGYGFVTGVPKVEDVVVPAVVEQVPEDAYAPPLDDTRFPETPDGKSIDDDAKTDGGDSLSKEVRDSPPQGNDSVRIFSDWNEKENQKPPVSARFAHRKASKSSPEGKGLRRVSKPKRQDTLESTWRTITEGRAMPLARHLKKSDTWDSHARRNPGPNDPNPDPMMKKSETFHEGSDGGKNRPPKTSLSPSPVSGKLRKEPSLSQDELNRRVEAFIKKFNEDMRLQRQESLNQYKEMIGRGGAH